MSDKCPTAAIIFVAILLALPVIYFGSYYALLVKTTAVFTTKVMNVRVVSLPNYRAGGEAAKSFFGPAYHIDRAIRPSYWQDQQAMLSPSPPAQSAQSTQAVPSGQP